MDKANQTTITRSYVLTPEGVEYTLKYSLASGRNAAGDTEYGVTVELHTTRAEAETSASESRLVSTDEKAVLNLIDLLARGFVFPDSLGDILEDRKITVK